MDNNHEAIDSYSLLTLPIPKETIFGVWLANSDSGGEIMTHLLLFTELGKTIVYQGGADALKYLGNIAHGYSLSQKRISEIVDDYLDTGHVELAFWKHDTGWILRRNIFLKLGLPLPAVPQPITERSWRKRGEVWF